MNAYAKMIKELHWPTISTEKKKQIVEIKQKLRESRKRNNKSSSPVVYTSFAKLKEGISKDEELESGDEKHNKSRLKVNSKSRNRLKPLHKVKWGKSMYTEEQEKLKRKEMKIEYKNYLKEFSHKRPIHQNTNESEDENEAFTPYYDWKGINENKAIDDVSKVLLLKEKANMLQERSELKQKLLNEGAINPEKANVANNYLIASIEAKLAILNKLNDREKDD